MQREIIATIYCPVCKGLKGTIYGVPRGAGVLENVTEPASMAGVKTCPDCTAPIEVQRPESP